MCVVEMCWSILFMHSFFFPPISTFMLRSHSGLFRLLLICRLLKILRGGIEMDEWREWVCIVSIRFKFLQMFSFYCTGFPLTFQCPGSCGTWWSFFSHRLFVMEPSDLTSSPVAVSLGCKGDMSPLFLLNPTSFTVLQCLGPSLPCPSHSL